MSDEMTFWDHLEVLRWSIFRTLGAILVLFVVAFAFMPSLFDAAILAPTSGDFFAYRLFGGLFSSDFKVDIVNINVTAPFFTHMRTAFMLALVVGFPYLLVEIWLFVKPALYRNEKRGMGLAMLAVAFLFYCGSVTQCIFDFTIEIRLILR